MDCDPGEEIFFYGHPSWRSMAPFHVKWSLASLVAGVAAGLASAVTGGRVAVGWVIVGVVLVFLPALWTGRLRRQRTTYAITSRRLTIETGLFSRRRHQARLEWIRHVSARQSLGQTLLGVGSVDFDTPAELELDLCFEGVGNPRAIVRLIDHLIGPT